MEVFRTFQFQRKLFQVIFQAWFLSVRHEALSEWSFIYDKNTIFLMVF